MEGDEEDRGGGGEVDREGQGESRALSSRIVKPGGAVGVGGVAAGRPGWSGVKEGEMKGAGNCPAYCKHGGVCELDEGHRGLHDSRYCTWDDAETVSAAKADAILLAKAESPEELMEIQALLMMQDLVDPRRRPS